MAVVSKGAAGEVLAARFLRDADFDIIAANYRSRFGEIDIIAQDTKYIVFVEVKTRGEEAYYLPREAVTKAKQQRIRKTAEVYLQRYPNHRQPRFDVIEVYTKVGAVLEAERITHLKQVF